MKKTDKSQTPASQVDQGQQGPGFISARRRVFLQGAAVGGVAVAAGAAVQAASAEEALLPEPVEKNVSAGYSETDHVKRYYRSARH